MSYNAKRDTPRMPDAPANRCSAHGCPLRATIFDATVNVQALREMGKDHGRCRYHDAADPKDWPYLTEIFQSRPFTREAIEPALAAVGLRWREPEPHKTGPYHSTHTGVTVLDAISFKRCWAVFSSRPPITAHKTAVGSFLRMGALGILDQEWDEERRAIQSESDPL